MRLDSSVPAAARWYPATKANVGRSSPAIGVQKRLATSAGGEFNNEDHGGRFHANLATKCLVHGL
jgi:hypothetical protein